MKRAAVAAVFVAVFFLAGVPARADTITTLTTTLSGPNESPVNASPGTGFATVTYDSAAHTLSVNVTFSGLTAGTTASHIHCCTASPGTGTAGVATTTPTFAGFPLGVTSGSFSSVLDLTLASSFNPAFVTANGGTPSSAEGILAAGLLNGNTYLNVHTSAFPGGEIRGFLVVTPEPSTSLLLVSGLAALIGFTRKRFPKT
jgi:hypothetical protein